MVVTASQMATSQFHSVPDRRRDSGTQASVTFSGRAAVLGGPAGDVIGLNANQRRPAGRPARLPLEFTCRPAVTMPTE